jgi:hypothetical protein
VSIIKFLKPLFLLKLSQLLLQVVLHSSNSVVPLLYHLILLCVFRCPFMWLSSMLFFLVNGCYECISVQLAPSSCFFLLIMDINFVLSLHPFLNFRLGVSYLCNTTGKIIFLCFRFQVPPFQDFQFLWDRNKTQDKNEVNMAKAYDGVSYQLRSPDGNTCLTRKFIARYGVVSET